MIEVLPYGARPKMVLGINIDNADALVMSTIEKTTQQMFPRHDVLVVNGLVAVAEVLHG